jgi:hypothetical protein
MTSRSIFSLVFAVATLCAANARAAAVAVMPVRGVNLTEGQSDAIGVMFATAFARDARVVVASPVETKPVRAQTPTALAAAAQLGASLHVELTAVRLGSKVVLAGTLFDKDGHDTFRAEATAESLDDVDAAAAKLAQSLVWRRPVEGTTPAFPAAPPALESPSSSRDPRVSSTAFGLKAGFSVPSSSGRSFSPVMGLQFDGRIGPRDHFVEMGAGVFIPVDDSYATTSLRVSAGFLELGGGVFLGSGPAALYLAGAVVPTIWSSRVGYDSKTAITCAVAGQVGATFTRDSRTRFFLEARLAQYLLGVADPIGAPDSYSTGVTDNYHPLLMSILAGVGW